MMRASRQTARIPLDAADHRRGFVLFIVAIVLVMITLAGATFVLTLSTEKKAARVYGQQIQREHLLGSGVEWLKAICEQPYEIRQQAGGMDDNPELFQSVFVGGEDETTAVGQFSVYSPPAYGSPTGELRYGLQDESAKLNLGVLSEWDRMHPGAATAALLNLPGMTDAMADAILDWIDSDDARRPAGAESEYYRGRGLPYGPRNGVPVCLEELLLIRDVSRFHVFGADLDGNYRVDREELSAAAAVPGGAAEANEVPWASLVTIYSGEKNVAADGQSRIDLNDDDLAALSAHLEQVFDRDAAKFIVAYRQFGPYKPGNRSRTTKSRKDRKRSSAKAGSRRSATAARRNLTLDLSLPARFRLQSVLDLIAARVAMVDERDLEEDEDIEQYILDSPFRDEPDELRRYLPQLLDRTTLDTQPVIRGRININLAPREVLLGIPGIEPAVVDTILSVRRGAIGDREGTAAWLVTEEVIDLQGLKSLLPFVTGRGDVFRAQIVAHGMDANAATRAEFVIDATASPARQLYWKQLDLLGRGFAPDASSVEREQASVADLY